jgi:hypothetical protein
VQRALGLILTLLTASVACSEPGYLRYTPATPPKEAPQARVFLIGDGGIASFREGEVPEQTQGAKKRVENKHPLPVWARVTGGEKKVFKDIVNEVIGLAVKNARQSRLLQTLKGEALNREHLAAGAVPLIVWLGDNVYEHGVPRDPGDQGYRDGELTPVGLEYVESAATVVVQAQVAVEAKANAVFVPGNHDWDHAVTTGPEGRERVIEEGEVLRRYVEERRAHGGLAEGTQIRLLPTGGCPGPAEVDVPIRGGAKVRVAAVDTEWLLTKNPDEGCVSGGRCKSCDPGTAQAVYQSLHAMAQSCGPRDAMIVVGHHPLRSYGLHGAQFFLSNPKSWLRWLPWSQEDAPSSRNKQLRQGLASIWETDHGAPLLYAAGHDHNLQLIRATDMGGKDGVPYVVISGSASKTSSVRLGKGSLFAHDQHGYMVADFFADGRVLLYIVEVAGNDSPVVRYPPVELRPAQTGG